MIAIQDAGGKAGIAAVYGRDAGGNFGVAKVSILMSDLSDYVVFDASAVSSLSASASPPNAVGADGSAADIIIDTNTVTVTASGGTEPYTYSWAITVGTPSDWAIETPLSRTTRFSCIGGVAEGATETATFRCTVTDSRGRTGTVDVEARVTNYGSIF
jgi:hypothetical protein